MKIHDNMVVALIVIVVGIAISFWYAHKNPDVKFNLFDLLMTDGKLSKVSCMVLGAFTVHTWIMIHLTLNDKMTEGYLTIYGATWVAPLLARMFSSKTSEAQP